jgi:hypothetical protein
VGLNVPFTLEKKINIDLLKCFRIYLVVTISSVISYLLLENFFTALDLVDFYPFLSLLIYIIISFLFDFIFKISTKKVYSDFCISFLYVLITVSESISIFDCFYIPLCCVLSFMILLLLVTVVIKRMENISFKSDFYKIVVIMIIIAIIAISLLSWNISWFNKDVFK